MEFTHLNCHAGIHDFNDSFGRFNPTLLQDINRTDLTIEDVVFEVEIPGKRRFFVWPINEALRLSPPSSRIFSVPRTLAKETGLAKGDAIHLYSYEKKNIKSAVKVKLTPRTLQDQILAVENAAIIESSLLLEQTRIAQKGLPIIIYLNDSRVIKLDVNSFEPSLVNFVKLEKFTEVEIEQPHRHSNILQGEKNTLQLPNKKSILTESILSLIPNDMVSPGVAIFNMSDFIQNHWTAIENKCLFEISPFDILKSNPIQTSNQTSFGLIGVHGGSGLKPTKGSLLVHPSTYLSAGLYPSTYIKYYSNIRKFSFIFCRVNCFTSTNGCCQEVHNLKVKSLDPQPKIPNEFIFDYQAGIIPVPFTNGSIEITKNPAEKYLFVKFRKDDIIEIDPCLPTPIKLHYELPQELDNFIHDLAVRLIKINGSGTLIIHGNELEWAEQFWKIIPSIYFSLDGIQPKELGRLISSIKHDLKFIPNQTILIFNHVDQILKERENLVEDDIWIWKQSKDIFINFLLDLQRPSLLLMNELVLEEKILSYVHDTVKAPILSGSKIVLNEPPAVRWEEVFGMREAKQALLENIIWPIKYAGLYKANGFDRASGALLYGPTGTGKTTLMQALSSFSGFNVIKVKGPELLSKYIGASEAAVRQVFQEARRSRPSLIMFDELDALAPRRGNDNTGVTDRVVNQLLTEIDGTEDSNGIFIVATTSRKDLIDPALLRSGRIDLHIPIEIPDSTDRADLITGLTGMGGDGIVKLVALTEGISPAHVKNILKICHENLEDMPALSRMISKMRIEPFNRADPTLKKQRATYL